MIYHNVDFMNENSVIESNSIDLIISSPPIDILTQKSYTLFNIFGQIVKRDGWILVDVPAELGLRYRVSSPAESIGRSIIHSYFVPHAYPNGFNEYIYAIHAEPSDPVDGNLPINRERDASHECEFCPTMIQKLIERYSEHGDTVLDPFCGTGTVPGVANEIGRVGIGCDLRPKENVLSQYRG